MPGVSISSLAEPNVPYEHLDLIFLLFQYSAPVAQIVLTVMHSRFIAPVAKRVSEMVDGIVLWVHAQIACNRKLQTSKWTHQRAGVCLDGPI